MYAVAKEYIEMEDEYELTDEQNKELGKRRNMRLNGESKGYSWSDAKKIIVGEENG